MLFGSPLGIPFSHIPSRSALFDNYPIGTRLGIGEDASFWVGSFGGIQNGVALLTDAQMIANNGKPVDGIRPVVRIPINQITFVSQ
jgi:hypothetical protein